MTWVKVCGLSRTEEVEAAVSAGADAVGFVTVAGSPRFIEPSRVAVLAAAAEVRRILLTADLEPARLGEVVEQTGVNGIQPYGAHALALAQKAVREGLLVLWPLRVRASGALPDPPAGTIALFDAHVPGKLGGTGESFDWERLRDHGGEFVVAGGLGPSNVGDLVRRVRPWGVDASSGLESTPGVKDLGKVTAFVQEAKRV